MLSQNWFMKAMSIPVLKWGVGVCAILIIVLVLVFKMMLNYKRRYEIAKKLRKAEKSYNVSVEKLESDEKAELADLTKVYGGKISKLKIESAKIDKASSEGLASLANMVNLTFKGASK